MPDLRLNLSFIRHQGQNTFTPDFPRGPIVGLGCTNMDELRVLNTRILQSRKPRIWVNAAVGAKRAVLSVFLDVQDKRGIPLTALEQDMLVRMDLDPSDDFPPAIEGKITRVVFGKTALVTRECLEPFLTHLTASGCLHVLTGFPDREGEFISVYTPEDEVCTFEDNHTELSYKKFRIALLADVCKNIDD